jgi:hypothetical protein
LNAWHTSGWNADGLAFHEHRLEALHAETVQRRSAVQQHRVVLDDLFENVPDLGLLLLDELLGALDRLNVAAVFELADDERLEQLQRHVLRQTALVQLQLGADDDHRAARVIDALAEQVLPEAALLALEHVGQRLERPVALAADGAAAAAVVEQRVDGLLQHALLVAQDDFRRLDLHELLQPVVAVDDAPVEIVEIRGREAAALERHQRPQIRRQHRDDLEDHPRRLVLGLPERLDHLEALEQILLLLRRRFDLRLGAQLHRQLLDVDLHQQRADRLGTHLGGERALLLLHGLEQLVLGDQLFVAERRGSLVDDHVRLVVQDALELGERHAEQVTDAAGKPLEEPDVRHRHRQLDVAEAFTTHLGLRHLDATAVADDAFVADPLVLPQAHSQSLTGPKMRSQNSPSFSGLKER